MSVSLEKIDMLMERANISYKEAKEALEQYDGDMVEALIYLESNQKTGGPSKKAKGHNHRSNERAQRDRRRQDRYERKNDVMDQIKAFVKKLHKTSFIVAKKGKKTLDIPLTIALIIILITLPASLFLLILPYVFGYKILILNEDGSKFNIDEVASNFDQKTAEAEDDLEEERFE